MRKVLLVILLPTLLTAQVKMFDQPLSPRIANYKIDCSLDVEKKLITGTETLNWRNTSEDEIDELRFHLYMNAFRDINSTFFVESETVPYFLDKEEINWGWCKIKKIIFNGKIDLTDRYEFIQPDDGNKNDRTVISLRLPEMIEPNGEIELEIEFETKLPRIISRTGFNENFFFVGQWFPKIGVYENGKWNCHQFHRNTEFYADFGVYDVRITVPVKFTVGATGILVDQKIIEDNKKLHYYCEDVHDFAWTADDDYIIKKEKYQGIDILLLCQPQNSEFINNYLNAVKIAIDYYGKTYGNYPYPNLTVVDPQDLNAADMEYPTLFVGSATSFDPNGERYSEWVNIHEFGHNYWQSMVASDEVQEVWLDEGINTYSTGKAFEYGIGKYYISNNKNKIALRDFRRKRYYDYARAGTVMQPAWTYRNRTEYFALTYTKPEMFLYTLNNYYGDEIWNKVMHTYFQRWKFKHPHTEDFINIVNEITGDNWNFFFDQFLETNQTVDFQILSVKRNVLKIGREGHLMFPVSILVKFSGGSEQIIEWNPKKRLVMFTFDKEIISVEIDPNNVIEFEMNKENNLWEKR